MVSMIAVSRQNSAASDRIARAAAREEPDDLLSDVCGFYVAVKRWPTMQIRKHSH